MEHYTAAPNTPDSVSSCDAHPEGHPYLGSGFPNTLCRHCADGFSWVGYGIVEALLNLTHQPVEGSIVQPGHSKQGVIKQHHKQSSGQWMLNLVRDIRCSK
jgi:hypothetical protein